MAEGGFRIGPWIIGASGLLSGALLAGRLSGLLRDLELAAAFGVSARADVAVLLLALPDLMVNLLLSGGLGAALIPRILSLSDGSAAALFRRALLGAVLAFGAAALAFLAWPRAVLGVLAPGLRHTLELPPAVALAGVAVAIPLTAAAGVVTAYLNARHRFFVAGCGTLIFNSCILGGLWLVGPGTTALLALGIGIGVGALVRLAAQLTVVPSSVWRSRAPQIGLDDGFRKAFFAATLSSSLILLVPVAVRAMASTLGSGAIASFTYALKLVELPVGILLGSITAVTFSRLSALYSASDSASATVTAHGALRRSVLLALAVTLPGVWFADSLVHLVLARGAMNAESLRRVASLFQLALLGVPAVAVSGVAVVALNARRRTGAVLLATFGCLSMLPVLALPGLVLNSERTLMLAVVCFQATHAFWLARSAGLVTFGSHGWLGGRMWHAVVSSVVLGGTASAIDAVFGIENHWLRSLLAGAAFACAALLPARLLQSSADNPDLPPGAR